MECFSLREGASKPIPAFLSILIVLLSPVIFCKALVFPLQQLANRYKPQSLLHQLAGKAHRRSGVIPVTVRRPGAR
jgi:hypothetical protein